MQAVIMAAGRGSRMGDLTLEVPKPMLPVAGRPILEYKFDALPKEIDEVVLVVGYAENVIREHFGNEYAGKRIVYAYQEELNGTAGALWAAKPYLKDAFLVLSGDDIYTEEDIRACLSAQWTMLVKESSREGAGGLVEVNGDGNVSSVIEGKGHGYGMGWINAAVYKLDTRFFDYPMVQIPGRTEYGLPQTMVAIAQQNVAITIKAVLATTWIQITSPEDLTSASKVLLCEMSSVL